MRGPTGVPSCCSLRGRVAGRPGWEMELPGGVDAVVLQSPGSGFPRRPTLAGSGSWAVLSSSQSIPRLGLPTPGVSAPPFPLQGARRARGFGVPPGELVHVSCGGRLRGLAVHVCVTPRGLALQGGPRVLAELAFVALAPLRASACWLWPPCPLTVDAHPVQPHHPARLSEPPPAP